VVQATDLRNADNGSLVRRVDRPWFGCILVQSQVTAGVMVQLINIIPIALIRGKFITVGILGMAARFGSTKLAAGVGSLLSAVAWSRANVHRSVVGSVPARSLQHHDKELVRVPLRDLGQKHTHRLGIDFGPHECI
jgi:hypothetical protein